MVIRAFLMVALAVAIAAFIVLVSLNGIGRIAAQLALIGWGFVFLVAIRFGALTVAAFGWAAASGAAGRVPLRVFIGLRMVREGVNCLLPVAQVGGDMVGGRLLAHFGIGLGLALAGILVDLFLQAATQGVFALSGLAALWRLHGSERLVREAGWILLLGVPAIGGFFLAQRFGLFLLVDRALKLFAGMLGRDRSAPLDLHSSLVGLYRRRSAILLAALLHVIAWFVGVAEIWAALHLLRLKAGLAEALILESLAQALKSAAFGVPGALGVQEGGLIVLGSLFGMAPATAIALSLAKRIPDIAIGLPGVIWWQYREAMQLRSTQRA